MQLFEVNPITFQSAIKRGLVNAGTFTSVFGDRAVEVAKACVDKVDSAVYRLEIDGDPVAQTVHRSLLGQAAYEQFDDIKIVRLPGQTRAIVKDGNVYVGEHMRGRLVEGAA